LETPASRTAVTVNINAQMFRQERKAPIYSFAQLANNFNMDLHSWVSDNAMKVKQRTININTG
jgi:hypothetical protein